MPIITLLGDSVLDNRAYVRPGEPDVAAQLRAELPGWTVSMRAIDGYCVHHVAEARAAEPVPPGQHVFLSAGGNDALDAIGLLVDPAGMTFAQAMIRLRDVREGFRSRYRDLLGGLEGARAMVATIYNPAFTGDEAALQAPAEGALSAFNDVIQQEAIALGFPVLDLRRLFSEPSDYANPIEPSAAGGAKIARAIARWVSRRVSQ